MLATGKDGLGGQAVYVTYMATGTQWVAKVIGTNVSPTSPWTDSVFDKEATISDDFSVNHNRIDPAVGPGGQLYVTWVNEGTEQQGPGPILFDFDRDGLFGTQYAFGTDTTVHTLTEVGWDPIPAQPYRQAFAIPVLDVDRFSRRLFIAWAEKAGSNDWEIRRAYKDTDANGVPVPGAWTVGTVDGGSDANANFNPWIDVDRASGSQLYGAVSVLYYRSVDGDPASVNVVIKTSIDGGVSFGNRFTMSTHTSNAGMVPRPLNNTDYLEYIGLSVHGGTVHAMWSDTRDNPETDFEAYYTRAYFDSQTNANQLIINGDDQGPTADNIQISYSAADSAYVSVQVNGQLQYAALESSINKIKITAGQGNDLIDASGINLAIDADGGAGDDSIIGGAGDDTIRGGTGQDIVEGGAGTDIFYMDDDTVDFILAEDGEIDLGDIDINEPINDVVYDDPDDWFW